MHVMTTLKKMTVIGLLLFVATGVAQAQSDKEAGRAEVRKSTNAVLKQLYAVQPSARKTVAAAPGYAVFSNFGMKILVAGRGGGSGVAVDNASEEATYMKMAGVHAGLGVSATAPATSADATAMGVTVTVSTGFLSRANDML